MRILVDPYVPYSKGAKALARSLGAKRIKSNRSRYVPRKSDVVVNWGNSNPRPWTARGYLPSVILNPTGVVSRAGNKLSSFQSFRDWNLANPETPVNYPEFTTDFEEAKGYQGEDRLVVSRSLLRASEGRGITVSPEAQLSSHGLPTKLWVRYKRGQEFRVHVFKGKVIDLQQKKRRNGSEAGSYVRSHSNGWVFTREGVGDKPYIETVKAQAILACKALGLDMAAVDVIYSVKKNKAWVLECNTAPGLEGSTVTSYSNAIRSFLNEEV